MESLYTERLELHPMTKKDAPFILEIVNSPGWLQNIGDRNVQNITDAENFIADRILKSYTDNNFGFYIVRLKSTGECVGMSGLVDRPGIKGIDIGYALLPAYYGFGYALESTKAVLNFAKLNLGLKMLSAITLPSNQRSINLLEKMGLKFVKPVLLPDDNEVLSLYKINFE